MPYVSLFTLPAALAICAAVNAARGDWSFYAWTSLLSLPIGLAILVLSPAVIFADPHDRRLLGFLTNKWMQWTTLPFFPITTQGTANLPPPGFPVVYVANHNSFIDIFALSWLQREGE